MSQVHFIPVLLLILFSLALLSVGLMLRRRRSSSPAGGVADAAADGPVALVDGRAPATVLVLGGLALVVMSHTVYVARRPDAPAALYLITFLGLAAFLAAGHALSGGDVAWLQARPLRRVMDYLAITPAQLLLLFLAPVLAYLARLAAGDKLLAFQPIVAVVAWLLAITAVVAGSYRRSPESGRLNRKALLLTAILFLAAFLVRAVALDRFPSTLSGDEASAGLVAAQFRRGQVDNLLGLGWFSFPAFYFAVQSAGVWLLGQTTAAIRLSSALAGAVTVVGVYWLARTLFGRLTGLLAALSLLAAHYHVHFSRIGLQNIWDGLFLVWALWGLWHGWKSGRRSSFVVAGVALGLGQYFYVSIRVVPLLFLIWAGVAYFARRDTFRQRLPHLILAAFIAAVIFLPLGLFYANHPAEFNAPMQRVTIFDGWLESEMAMTGQPAARVIVGEMRKTLLGFTHLPLRHWYNPGTPLLLAVPAALFWSGVLWAVYLFDLRSLLLLLPILSVVVLGGLSQDAPASQRFVLATPTAAILVALPLGQAAAWLRALWPRYRTAVAAAALLLMSLTALNDLDYYFFEVYDEYVLGGTNTQVATAVAAYLQQQEDPTQDVYFFGLPRMGYYSLSTIRYLAPGMRGHDVEASLTAPPAWQVERPAIFIFLPERRAELSFVKAAYPGGNERTVAAAGPSVAALFVAYELRP